MPVAYAPEELAVIAFAMLFAGFVKGATGLGYSTTCLPIMALALGLKASLPLALAPSLASNVAVMLGAGPVGPAARRFWPMLCLAPVGVVCGAALLGRVEGDTAGAALGCALIAWIAFAAAKPDWRLDPRLERPAAPAVGLVTGTINGLTGSQVLPITPFLMSLDMPRGTFLHTLNLSFTLSSLTMAAALTGLGLMTRDAALVSLCGVALSISGVRAGGALRRRLPERAFRNGVLAVLGLAGAALIVRGLG
ncbi:MAG: sulfite exporter TauE/SafE family protein [Pseudomonadota bacterium]|nr:sulfite exporter TauE/SafE family protein [Pseudomonadota bacterium]